MPGSQLTTPTGERLLGTAAALFRKKGYAGTSIRDIAAALGIQTASLYYYMSGKEELLEAVCRVSADRLYEQAVEALAEAKGPRERLQALVLAFARDILVDDRDLHTAAILEIRALSPSRRKQARTGLARFKALLEQVVLEGQQAGLLRSDVPARHLARALNNLIAWSIIWFDPEDGLAADELADLYSMLFLEGALKRERSDS